MELSDLHVFRTVVHAGGVTPAAQRLHRVPSNVTTRIRKLEDDLGTELFLREGKRMLLSPAGQRLLDYAERLLHLAQEARDAVQDDGAARGTIRLGVGASTAAARLPALMSEMQARHPQLSVDLHISHTQALSALVLGGSLDAALVVEPVVDDRLASHPAYLEELVLVAAPQQPAIRTAKDVQRRVLLAFEPGCPYRHRLEAWFARGGVTPDRLIEVGSYHAILGCCVAGMGVGLMPRSVLATFTERDRLSVHPLRGDFRLARSLLVWRKAAPPRQIQALVGLLPGRKMAR